MENRKDSMIIPGNMFSPPRDDVHLTTVNRKKYPYPKCSNCGVMTIGAVRSCARCGQPFTNDEIVKARQEAGKCLGCGFNPCRCDKVREELKKDPECGLVLIEDWKS